MPQAHDAHRGVCGTDIWLAEERFIGLRVAAGICVAGFRKATSQINKG
jgi:hypothetical protein